MTTEDDFRRAINDRPDDRHLLLVFADWLDEHGDPRANGYRALARQRKRPSVQTITDYRERGWVGDWFVWAKAEQANRGAQTVRLADPDTLPADWYDAAKGLSQLPGWEPGAWAYFRTAAEAIDAGALGFAKLPDGRRAELLAEPTEQSVTGREQAARKPKRK